MLTAYSRAADENGFAPLIPGLKIPHTKSIGMPFPSHLAKKGRRRHLKASSAPPPISVPSCFSVNCTEAGDSPGPGGKGMGWVGRELCHALSPFAKRGRASADCSSYSSLPAGRGGLWLLQSVSCLLKVGLLYSVEACPYTSSLLRTPILKKSILLS